MNTPAPESAHTPGPWSWREFGSGLMLVTVHQGSRVVLSAHRSGSLQTRDTNGTLRFLDADHPNARLIAAAPDLLAALKALVDEHFAPRYGTGAERAANWESARAAILKAQGGK